MGHRTLLASWVLVGKLGEVIDVLVNNYPQIISSLVGRDVGNGEALRHVC